MSTNKTENLSLQSWDQDDPVLRSEFNENFAAIDAACGDIPKIAFGTYIGTGQNGSSNPNRLTFPFQPKLLFIRGCPGSALGSAWYGEALHTASTCTTVWNGNTVVWYNTGGTNPQMNELSKLYLYLIIG